MVKPLELCLNILSAQSKLTYVSVYEWITIYREYICTQVESKLQLVWTDEATGVGIKSWSCKQFLEDF